MKQLNFTLLGDNKTVLKFKSNYYIKDNKIHFKDKDNTYLYDKNKKVFIKKNNESIISIYINNKNMVIELVKEKCSIANPIESIKLEEKDNLINIVYTINNGDLITNNIIIEY